VGFKKGQIKIYLTRTGLLMEGHSTSLRRLFAYFALKVRLTRAQ
jgi:hypothetical protein